MLYSRAQMATVGVKGLIIELDYN